MKPPRPAILFTATYWAGLATGLLHFGGPAGVTALSLGIALSGRPLGFLAAGGMLAGRLSGEFAVALEGERCAARLPAA
ncbi:MAG: hypothetical protein L0Y54_23330, partial [Sporichthyaceae bacterium]|nr:hypothetical protein [Sporichthyaceae bacterium]